MDDELILEKRNVKRVWHHLRKHPSNPLILKSGHEENLYLFGTVMQDTDPMSGIATIFRMWYYAVGGGTSWVAYARSHDGLTWEKPGLGIVEIGGKKGGNAVFRPQGWGLLGLSGVIKDDHCPESERYKLMIPAKNTETGGKTYLMAVSHDGLHWESKGNFTPDLPCNPDRACFIWDPFRKVYALYNRVRYDPPELKERGGPSYWGRAIALCTSKDFKNWSKPKLVMHAEEDDPDGTELYGMAAFPYQGQWVGLVQIHRSIPHLAYIDLAVAHSRDGKKWRREKELVLPRGGIGEWDRFNQCASTRPIKIGDEIWVYYSGRLYRHGEYRTHTNLTDTGPSHVGIGLATLRLDGWCSLQASFGGGDVVTKTLILPKSSDLFINVKSDWGEVIVRVLDEDGDPVERMESLPISADGVSVKVLWPDTNTIKLFTGKPIRLKFSIRNAKLYSWKVE